jgi:hypothetical protein
MPGLRIQYFRGPVWGKTNEQIRKQIVEGNNPITGRPVVQELVEKLTKPLTAEESKTDELKPPMGPATYTGTPDELQQLFLEKRYTDFMPIILPTEEKVAEMLKATSHKPEEQLGRMNPGSEVGETWTYTVKTAAISAVMAGAKPEYFPLILAIGSTGQTGVNVSDNGFMGGAVINGTIRDEIKLNYEIGAVGPYAQANTTIGRAWNLLSINGGNCGKVGTTYMGTVGNPMNAINVIIAENERDSPFKPLSVRRGFKEGENVVTMYSGWGILSAANWKADAWRNDMNYAQIVKDICNQQGSMFGCIAVLSPPIANFVKDAGYDTGEKFTEFVRQPVIEPASDALNRIYQIAGEVVRPQANAPAAAAPAGPAAGARGAAPAGPAAGPAAGAPAAGAPPAGARAGGPAGGPAGGAAGGRGGFGGGGRGGFGGGGINFSVVVTGGSNNNYFMMGGMVPGAAVQIDKWR